MSLWGAFLLAWFALLHAALVVRGPGGLSVGAYVANLVAIILLAAVTIQ